MLEAEVERHDADLVRYRDNPSIIATLGVERYEQGLRVRSRRVDRALLALAAARRRDETHGLPSLEEARQRWPAQTLPERRELLREVFDCVFVLNESHGPGEARFHPCLRGEAPADLPERYPRPVKKLSPFEPSEGRTPPRLGAAGLRPWGDARVRAELSPFLRDRDAFPVFIDFQREGLALLHRQVEIHGGCGRWATEFGLSHSELHRPLKGWSEERVRSELADFLPDGEQWPTAGDFRRAHRLMLYIALKRYGGRERWAAEFGRKLSWRQRDTTTFWTEARIEQALRSLADEASTFPTRKQMATAGYRGLYSAVGPTSSRVQWAERLGLSLRHQARASRRWTDQEIKRQLRPLVLGRRVYPTRSDFTRAGKDHLYQVIGKWPGGHAQMAQALGLVRVRPDIARSVEGRQ